jgi:hypothetical protein
MVKRMEWKGCRVRQTSYLEAKGESVAYITGSVA